MSHTHRWWMPALLAAASWAATAQPVAPAAASAASGVTNPTVQAAEKSRAPGELRPEKPVVPQVVLTLPNKAARAASAARPAASADADGLMDEAARCAAIRSKATRQACLARLEHPSRSR